MLSRNSTPIKLSLYFAIFSFIWALAGIFHYFSIFAAFTPGLPGDYKYLLSFAVFLAALFLLLKPASLLRLNTYCFLQVLEVFFLLPEVPNHWLLTFFVNSTILASYSMRSSARENKLFSALRWQVVILYFFSFFHKLNSDFLNPAHSCASIYYRRAADWLPFLSTSDCFIYFVIYGTLALEFLLFAMLFATRTRKYAVFLGLFLHLFFTFSIEKNFFNFSSTMFALLFLFLDPASVESLARDYLGKFFANLRFSAVLFSLVLLALNFLVTESLFFGLYYFGVYLFWFSYAAVVLFLFSKNFARLASARAQNSFSSLYVFVLLVFLNGLSPYLGIKTRTAWQMYSNLWLSETESNHLILPRSLDLFGYMAAEDDSSMSELGKKLSIFSAWEREAAKKCVW